MKKIEVIPKAVAEKLEAHAAIIHNLIAAQRRGAAEQFGYAFLAGRALLQAKAIVPNGNIRAPNAGFKRWVLANFPEITMRTAENWMLFAESILSRAQVDAASSPLLLGSVELTGQSHDSILQLVPEVMDGKGMMRFMRETRLLRLPERPRFFRRNPASASEASRENSARARRLWESIVTHLDSGGNIVNHIENTADLERYLNMLTGTAHKIRALLKKRSEAAR
jgi:hypothetical protein